MLYYHFASISGDYLGQVHATLYFVSFHDRPMI